VPGFSPRARKTFALAGIIFFLLSFPALAQEATIRLTVGQSVILDFPQLKQVAVGDATIADVKVVAGRQQVMVTGLVEGSTNLTIWLEEGKKLSRLIRVFTRDPEVILRDVKALLKDAEGVNVRVVGDKVVIDGEVLSDRDYQRVEQAVQLYPLVVNLAQKNQISLKPMVEIDVKIMEVSRGLREAVGMDWQNLVNFQADWTWEHKAGSLKTSPAAEGWQASLVSGFGSTLNLMLSRGLGRVLSNPILICRSGAKASFLAGGQIPVPISKGLGEVDIQWKDYGVGLAFEPFTDSFGNVSMSIRAEISDLDFANAVSLSGTTIPAIKTRKAETSVNMVKDETLVLSELYSSRDAKTVDKVPVLGSIPIIGELFKSRNFQQDKTEFLVFVTPRLVRPGSIGKDRVEKMKKSYQQGEEELKPKLLD
jgi:pilus assembly protein CpaC